MDRSLARSWLVVCLIVPALLSPRIALGAPNDAAAQKLRDQAINQDYLGTDFAAAEKKLTDALTLCKKTTDCSPFIRARLHCDLGVVEFMLHKIDLARTEFATALMEDPSVDLDKDLSNTDVRNEFAALKSGGPPPPATAPTPVPATSKEEGSAGFAHVPPASQQVFTPLPLYVGVLPDVGVAKVIVRFKGVGARDWKTAPLRKMGDGYGGEIPCGDVGSQEGELQYFLQGLDANGDLVVANGGSAAPHSVAIVKKLEGEPPHLPGELPPEACKPASPQAETGPVTPATTDVSDCPPGFPGCHGEGPTTCDSKEDCMSDEACVDHVCKRPSADEKRAAKKNWISLTFQADALNMPGANNVCLGANPPNGYTCFLTGTSTYYSGIPVQGADDQVISGFAQNAPMFRISLGYDRALTPNLTLGGRLGYVVSGGGPARPAHGSSAAGASFLPVNVEGRLGYYFGKNILARRGLRFFVFASGGAMEVDAYQSIDVRPPPPANKLTNVDAWTKTGLGFVAAGPGLMWAITPNTGFFLEIRPTVLFPTFGFSLGGLLGYTIGL